MDPRIGLIVDGIIGACRAGWRRLVGHRDADTIPIISCDGGRDVDDHTASDGVSTQRKNFFRLARLSGTVCGIEFCYAAETAFVTPVLLRIGIPQRFMTMIWCLSPLVGFFVMPLLGSASDRCASSLGRRRPFILLLSAIIFVGLLLVPNGYRFGLTVCGHESSSTENYVEDSTGMTDYLTTTPEDETSATETSYFYPAYDNSSYQDEAMTENNLNSSWETTTSWSETVHIVSGHACGVIFTIIGVVFLDFSCDACQSPSRAYLIDVTHPSDHARGLATFSFMAGFGGAAGYLIGGIPWGHGSGTAVVGAHVRYVFGLITIIFVVAVLLTVTAEREKTLSEINPIETKRRRKREGTYGGMDDGDEELELGVIEQKKKKQKNYGSGETEIISNSAPSPAGPEGVTTGPETGSSHPGAGGDGVPNGINGTKKAAMKGEGGDDESDGKMLGMYQSLPGDSTQMESVEEPKETATMGTYLLSIVFMPPSLRILCFTHLMGWMSLLCYSLYFTDFMGQEVYGGNPIAPPGSEARRVYSDGVRLGSYAMALYSITCSICSLFTETLISKLGAKTVYVGNQVIYCVSMALLAAIRTPWAAFLFSATAGIEYSTLFTLPFILLANYHSTDTFYKTSSATHNEDELDVEDSNRQQKQPIRGLGTDVSLVQSMVFVAQFFLSLCMGSIVHAVGSTVAIVGAACVLSGLGALAATQVMYAGL
ncbi:membrane-associated transporter protein-like [Diadema setosum]|uniref:membrane-associated transporter protein-like n=1 Tax=Diadema setosum TaxID=31175 RepID=UPI003B3B933A